MTNLTRHDANDLEIDGGGMLKVSTGKDAYASVISNAIQTMKGELWSDTSFGIEYFDTVMSRSGALAPWEVQMRNMIESFPFVVSIIEFTTRYDSETNNLSFTLLVETDEGQLEIRN